MIIAIVIFVNGVDLSGLLGQVAVAAGVVDVERYVHMESLEGATASAPVHPTMNDLRLTTDTHHVVTATEEEEEEEEAADARTTIDTNCSCS